MSEDLNDELLDSGTETQRKRPNFLLVLCILTFVGAGLGTLGALFSVFTMGAMESTYAEMNNAMGSLGSELGVNFEDSYKWAKLSNYMNLLGNVLCLAGALFMFKLRKVGFYMYVPGQIIPIIGGFLAMNSMLGGGIFAGFGVISIAMSAMIAIGFIVMYGLNLKHMN